MSTRAAKRMKTRITAEELAAIERRARHGPKSADVSNVMAAYHQARKDILLLVAELREPRQERIV